ncbi:hypothetical protein C8R45DRAFT_1074464 [Mycena sanguinolenta]|nr:hypothetical protein C8R45DRAFT_1074464 [Mycena sanguinolenta]
MAPKFSLSILHKFRRVSHAVKPRRSAPILLLDLPCELRLEIYDTVANLPVKCMMPTVHMEDYTVNRLPIPWFSLMLVCKPLPARCSNAFENVRHIHATFPPRSRTSAPSRSCWSAHDNEPTPLIHNLCKVLKTFIQNGPLVTRERPLTQRIHLDTLIAHSVKINRDTFMFVLGVDREWKEKLWPDMQQCISWVVDRGVLFGTVDKIVCEWVDDGDRVEWEVRPPTIGDMMESGSSDFCRALRFASDFSAYDCRGHFPLLFKLHFLKQQPSSSSATSGSESYVS